MALLMLGVIATYTIPKVLQAQQNGSSNATAKETAAAVSQAFQTSKYKGDSPYGLKDITPFLNYVSKDTTSLLNATPGNVTPVDCSDWTQCYKLHNGAVLYFWPWRVFCNTEHTGVDFYVDPDGRYTTSLASDAVGFLIYNNGRLTTYKDGFTSTGWNDTWVSNGPCNAWAVWWSNPTPGWFSW